MSSCTSALNEFFSETSSHETTEIVKTRECWSLYIMDTRLKLLGTTFICFNPCYPCFSVYWTTTINKLEFNYMYLRQLVIQMPFTHLLKYFVTSLWPQLTNTYDAYMQLPWRKIVGSIEAGMRPLCARQDLARYRNVSECRLRCPKQS